MKEKDKNGSKMIKRNKDKKFVRTKQRKDMEDALRSMK